MHNSLSPQANAVQRLDTGRIIAVAQLQWVLPVVGVASFVFGVGDLAAGLSAISLRDVSASSYSFMFILSLLTALVNGILVLVASYQKSRTWTSWVYGSGIIVFLVHLVDIIFLLPSLTSYGYSSITTYEVRYGGNNNYNGQHPYLLTPATAQSARFVIVFVLIVADLWQVYVTGMHRLILSSSSNTNSSQSVVVIQTAPPSYIDSILSLAAQQPPPQSIADDLPPPYPSLASVYYVPKPEDNSYSRIEI